jgi:uncharacterized protein YjgD (DUF1641 family)
MALEDPEKGAPVGAAALLVEAGFETLTDEMVGRLAQTASESLTLLEEIHASRLTEALPVIKELVASGDLARFSQLVRVLGAAEDALTDDLVGRLAGLASHGMALLERVTGPDSERYWELGDKLAEAITPALLDRYLKLLPVASDLLTRLQETAVLEDVLSALARTSKNLAGLPQPGGGLSGLWALMKDAENQRTLQALLVFGRQFLASRARS